MRKLGSGTKRSGLQILAESVTAGGLWAAAGVQRGSARDPGVTHPIDKDDGEHLGPNVSHVVLIHDDEHAYKGAWEERAHMVPTERAPHDCIPSKDNGMQRLAQVGRIIDGCEISCC